MDASPNKRRALGPIDVNSRITAASSKLEVAKLCSPVEGKAKRCLDDEPKQLQHQQRPSSQPIKRQRLSMDGDAQPITADEELGGSGGHNDDNDGNDGNEGAGGDSDVPECQRSDTPDEDSSMFDNSVIDTSLATTVTEPDTEEVAPAPTPAPVPVPAPARQRSPMSREEARRKAEMLRLRLGLASYKVRTGQTDVPLDQLKVKPLLGANKSIRHGQPSLPPLPRTARVNGDSGALALPHMVAPLRRNDVHEQVHLPVSSPSTSLPVLLPNSPLERQEEENKVLASSVTGIAARALSLSRSC